MDTIQELLADIQHDIWSHWTRWQFGVCRPVFDEDDEISGDLAVGDLSIPAVKVDRWERQMNTPYSELTDKEQNSDREQADKIIAHLKANGYVIVKAEDPKQAQH